MTEYRLESAEQACSARKMLPTMYDLPSEDPEEPGVPDLFHPWQSNLLSETFRPPDYDEVLTAPDLNLYYDAHHTNRYKRPDWFAVPGISPYENREIRLSYVIWQEEKVPFIVVELLSPSTEKDDLGKTHRKAEEPPTKWEVYEQILRVPYYAVFSRYTDKFRAFRLAGGEYREIVLPEKRLWMPEMKLGLGVWSGTYQKAERLWLRFYDSDGNWIPTDAEGKEQERQRADREKQRADREKQRADDEKRQKEQERERAEKLLAHIKSLGIDPDTILK